MVQESSAFSSALGLRGDPGSAVWSELSRVRSSVGGVQAKLSGVGAFVAGKQQAKMAFAGWVTEMARLPRGSRRGR